MMLLAALLAPIAVLAPVAANVVAPPLATPIRQTNEQVRDDGRTRRRFRIARTLLFAAEPGGFRLTATMTDASADADPGERARYRAANAPMIGRAIVLHLDRAGALLSIDDLDAVWRDWTAGLTAAAPGGLDARADTLRRQLDAIGAPQQRALVGSVAESLFAPPENRVVGPSRPVTIASPPPFAGLSLTGTTMATAEPGGIRVHMTANGRSPATSTAAAASLAIGSDLLVDPVSGLIRSSVRREALASTNAKLITTTTSTLDW